jgi:hypothetical protein
MDPLKIGVLTFHRCINYGSYWQAKCLAEGLQQLGHKVEILDHYSGKVNLAEWRCALRPVLPTPIPEADIDQYRQKMLHFFCAFSSLPLSAPFPLQQPEVISTYDLIVVGSDEVWNLHHPWYAQYPIFYGKGLRAPQLISYAASFGNYPHTLGLPTHCKELLSRFDHIAVRDENSRMLVKNSIGITPELVLDPCLQFPLAVQKKEPRYKENSYIAVYGHNFSPSFIQRIKTWATKHQKFLVSIGYRNDWADEQWITAGPHDFATFMAHSEAVVTNFFHGCVFALHYEKPFVCEISPYRGIKIQGLMEMLDGTRHLISETSGIIDLNTLLHEPIQTSVLQRISTLRESSYQYLHDTLIKNQIRIL